ncbi:MAG: MetS family NSS transporter small subunit [Anaerovoracaceae bacterium]|jgi:hypothetical protein
MSIDAIIMMVIGCGLLWGGFIASSINAIRHGAAGRKDKKEHDKDGHTA